MCWTHTKYTAGLAVYFPSYTSTNLTLINYRDKVCVNNLSGVKPAIRTVTDIPRPGCHPGCMRLAVVVYIYSS